MSPDKKPTLMTHRLALKHFYPPPQELQRLTLRLCEIVRMEGRQGEWRHFGTLGNRKYVADLVRCLFKTQDDFPFFWVDAGLPNCWNHPKDWGLDYIKYEWGHVHPKHQDGNVAGLLENLCLMSARCNNHIQSALTIEELLDIFGGSKIGRRLEAVMARRARLFASEEWQELKCSLRNCPPPQRITLETLGLAPRTPD